MTKTDAALRVISPVPAREKVQRLLWAVVQGTLFRFSFHTWSPFRASLLRLFGARVGAKCTVRRTARVYYPWLFSMGDLSSLGDRAEVYNLGHVELGSRVTISQEAYLCAGSHDYTRIDMPLLRVPIRIEDDAWICARAFVMPGVTIGTGAILGACGVATHDLEPWSVYAGNPATRVKNRETFSLQESHR